MANAIINNYTPEARLDNQSYGLQTLLLEQDENGRPTGVVPDNTADFLNSSDGYVDTGFKPNLSTYSIVEAISGSFGNEMRILTHDEGVEDIYTINNSVETTPVLPDPDTLIELDNIASIGDADIVETYYNPFQIYTKVLTTAEKTALYDAWVLEFNIT